MRGNRVIRRVRRGVALCALGTLFLLSGPALAATVTVNTFAQGSVAGCSLAEAIASINGGADTGGCIATGPAYGVADTIVLPNGTFNLAVADNGTNGLPVITQTVTINGNGATIARTGAPSFRILEVTGGSLTLNNLTLTGGNPGAGSAGGAILASSTGTLSLTDTRLTANTARSGGAINFDNGALVVTASTFAGNSVTNPGGSVFGGAIDASSGSDVTITGSVFSNTTATAGAGSVFGGVVDATNVGNLVITGSTFANTTATATGGSVFGGVVLADNGGNATITGSTFANTTATATSGSVFGGAVDATSVGNLVIIGSTFANTTATATGGSVFGGAVDANNGGNATITGSTFANTTATASSSVFGGAVDADNGGNLSVTTSIFALNTASGASSSGGAILADHDGTTGIINNNCFSGNTAASGGAVNRGGSPAVDATNNWWGDPSGPSEAGPGTGDGVTSNVIFSPFLTAGCPINPVPTLSTWTQLAVVALLVLGGLLVLRRRSRAA